MTENFKNHSQILQPIVEGLKKRFSDQHIYIPRSIKRSDFELDFCNGLFERKKHQSLRAKLSCKFQEHLCLQAPNLCCRIRMLRKASARFLPFQVAQS